MVLAPARLDRPRPVPKSGHRHLRRPGRHRPIDPIYFQKSYYPAPGGKENARTYALLGQAMEATNKVAIGTFVMRGKEYLAAVRAAEKVLVLETMFFADEVRNPRAALTTLPREVLQRRSRRPWPDGRP